MLSSIGTLAASKDLKSEMRNVIPPNADFASPTSLFNTLRYVV